MWERQKESQGMEKEVQAGSMLTSYSAKYDLLATVELGSSLNTLQVMVKVGDCVYLSEWLDVSPLLDRVATVHIIREGLRRWLERATLLSSKASNGLPPIVLTSLIYEMIDPCLA